MASLPSNTHMLFVVIDYAFVIKSKNLQSTKANSRPTYYFIEFISVLNIQVTSLTIYMHVICTIIVQIKVLMCNLSAIKNNGSFLVTS